MAAMFSNNEESVRHFNPNKPLPSSFFPFMDEHETLILQQQKKKPRLASWESLNQLPDIRYYPNPSLASLIPPFFQEHQTLISPQITKKPRLASWGCGDGSFNKFSDIRYNLILNQSLAYSIPPFFHEHQTLISQQNTKKPRLEPPWWSADKSLDQLSVIFEKPLPTTLNSTAGVSKPPPEVIVDEEARFVHKDGINYDEIEEEIPELSDFIINNTPLISPLSSVVSRPHPDLIVIDVDELIEEEIPKLSDFIFDITSPPIASPMSSVVSKSLPEVITIDDEEEEEIVVISNDDNLKLDSNGKESSSINDKEEDLRSVAIDSEEKKKKKDSDGGFGHVFLDDLGVTVEDLKRIPWEAFDPSLGIKSVMLDPSFGWICSTDY